MKNTLHVRTIAANYKRLLYLQEPNEVLEAAFAALIATLPFQKLNILPKFIPEGMSLQKEIFKQQFLKAEDITELWCALNDSKRFGKEYSKEEIRKRIDTMCLENPQDLGLLKNYLGEDV